ncbi:hypothetical protein TWF225_006508 [Orbilia oligospora]|nr:hypothetical protein TWF225_006508 [Orbilia oligospora]KAF3265019.1 hypothetical protein TWF217_002671 [Orbilia oligospora]KAF3268108.1 hypothetical protein TWF128_008119 [Orbilia oligospora]KAF3282209.1 hypothetical protein TWF132_010786 [Orbilia oligospora]
MLYQTITTLSLLFLTSSTCTADIINTTIHTPSTNLYLQRSPSGSLILFPFTTTSPPPPTFISNSSFISQDTLQNHLVYFPSDLTATNLSRVLLQPLSQMPLGARGLRLTYMQGSSGLDGIYIGTDTLENGVYLIACVPLILNNNITLLVARNSPFPPNVEFTNDVNAGYLPFTTLGFQHDGCEAVTLVAGDSGVEPLAWGSVAPKFGVIGEEEVQYVGGVSD